MSAKATAAARLLLEARRERQPLPALPRDLTPASAAEAYAIHDVLLGELGPRGGWKVGAASSDVEPVCAPLPASGVVRSPHAFAPGSFHLNGLEAELAFTLARNLPPRAAPYSEADVVAALASVHPAIEVVDSRYADVRAVDAWSALADFGSHGALVVGPAANRPDLRVDQMQQRAVLEVNGTVMVDQVGGNSAGDVFRLLVWLANHGAARVGGLRAGEVVTTGSCTGLRFAESPARVRALLDGIGVCELAL